MSRSIDVTVDSEPTVLSFTTASSVVTAGESVALTATFLGGTASIDQGAGAVISGQAVTVGPLNANTVYTLTVSDGQGHSDTATVQVNVVPVPSISSYVADANAVLAGQKVHLTGAFAAGPGGTASIGGGVGAVSSGVAVATPAVTADTNFVLTVQNAAGRAVTRGYVITATLASDCMQAAASGLAPTDGIYPIGPSAAQLRNVWCDMTSDGGGWTRLYHGTNGAANYFASFTGSDSCASPNTNCLQHMPTSAGSDVQLLVSCGTSQVRFTPSAAVLTYLKAGTVAGWQATTHAVSLNGGHASAASAFLAGDANGAWLLNVTADVAVPQAYANASPQSAAALQGCGGALSSTAELSLAYREPVRMADSLELQATPVANQNDATPVVVRMLDQYGELLTSAADSIVLSSGDSAAVLPVAANLVGGALTQNVTLNTLGSQWVNASTGLVGATVNLAVVAGATGTAASPAQSCNDILAAGSSGGSGVYSLSVNSSTLPVYCDMTYAGGGWTLLMATGEKGPSLLPVGVVTPGAPGAVSVAVAQALAQTATQVHIRSASAAAAASITSVASSQPIVNLQNGVQLSSNQVYDASTWTGPYSASQYTAFDASCTATAWPAVYRACGMGGLQLAGNDSRWLDNGGDLYGNQSLEIYVR